MNSKSYLLSFAKAKGNMAAVAFAAILMAANATVASAQNKATENNGTEKTVIGGGLTTFMALILRQNIVQTQRLEQIKPMEIRLYVCIMSVPKSF